MRENDSSLTGGLTPQSDNKTKTPQGVEGSEKGLINNKNLNQKQGLHREAETCLTKEQESTKNKNQTATQAENGECEGKVLAPYIKNKVDEQEKQLDQQEKIAKGELKLPEKKIYIRKDANELVVISRMRDLANYVLAAASKIPKNARFSFATKIQSLCLDILANMVRANTIVVRPKKIEQYKKRYEFQEKALCDLKVLEYMVAMAVEQDFMLFKQFTQIAKKGAEVSILLNKWIESDKRRFLAG